MKNLLQLWVQCEREITVLEKNVLIKKQHYQYTGETNKVLIVRMIQFYLCVFDYAGQSYGCGGCSRPS